MNAKSKKESMTNIIIISIVLVFNIGGLIWGISHSNKLFYELIHNPVITEGTIIRLNTSSSIPIVLGRTTMAGSHPSLRYEYKIRDTVFYGSYDFNEKNEKDKKLLSQIQLGDKFIVLHSDSCKRGRMVFDCPITDTTPLAWYIEEFKTNPVRLEPRNGGLVFRKRE